MPIGAFGSGWATGNDKMEIISEKIIYNQVFSFALSASMNKTCRNRTALIMQILTLPLILIQLVNSLGNTKKIYGNFGYTRHIKVEAYAKSK